MAPFSQTNGGEVREHYTDPNWSSARSFAHAYETGAPRRLYVRGKQNVQTRLLLQAAACNLALLLRETTGAGTLRALHDGKLHATNRRFVNGLLRFRDELRRLSRAFSKFLERDAKRFAIRLCFGLPAGNHCEPLHCLGQCFSEIHKNEQRINVQFPH